MKIKNILFKILPIVSIAVLFFSFGILFIPFSGVAFRGGKPVEFNNWVSAFGAFFPKTYLNPQDNWFATFYENTAHKAVAPVGIVIYSFMLIALIALVATAIVELIAVLKKKPSQVESFYKLLGGIFTTVTGVTLNSLQLWMVITYPTQQPVVLWCPYIAGILCVIFGGLTLWAAIDALIKEKNAPLEQKGYSYLKKK